MRKSLFSLSLLTSLTLVSCSTILNNLPGVYTLEIQQGNIIDQAMVDQLRPGMNKRQVLYIMGSPMLDDVFHKNRWDYLYSDQPGGEDRVQKRISLFFENDQIAGVQGDFRPSATPVIKTSGETTVDVPKRNLDKTLWEKITSLIGYDELDAPSKTDEADTKP
ncbi:MAG: outer membrane protein assembly factor BamE [Gammaproteobacteria bacterium]